MSQLTERLRDMRYYEADGVEAQAADEIDRLGARLATLKVACRHWLDSPNNRQRMAEVRDLCKQPHPMNQGALANMGRKEDWDCGCSDGAEDVCISITCPRK